MTTEQSRPGADWVTAALIAAAKTSHADLLARLEQHSTGAAREQFIHINIYGPQESRAVNDQRIPKTITELRVQTGVGAARAAHVFDRTLLSSDTPMPPAVRETNLVACFATTYGFALVEVLRLVAEHGDQALADSVLHAVLDIGSNGDDGRCHDIFPQIQAQLDKGGIGTDAWDAEHLPTDNVVERLVAFRNLVVAQREALRDTLAAVATAAATHVDSGPGSQDRAVLRAIATSARESLAKLPPKVNPTAQPGPEDTVAEAGR